MINRDRQTIIIQSPYYSSPLDLVKSHIQSFTESEYDPERVPVKITEIFMLGGKTFVSIEPVEEFRRRFQGELPE